MLPDHYGPLFVDHVIYEVVSHFPTNPRILDLGCGFGRLVPVLNQLAVTNIVGVDSSAGMLKEASRLYPSVDYRLGDMGRNLAEVLGDTPFDGFFAIASLMHVLPEKVPNIAKTLRASMKTGAVGFISTPSGNAEELCVENMGGRLQNPDKSIILRVTWDLQTLGTIFFRAGFILLPPSYTEGGMIFLTVRAI